jgi:hypothetical protein
MRNLLAGLVVLTAFSAASVVRADEGEGSCSAAQREGDTKQRAGKLVVAHERFAACAAQCPSDARVACERRRDELERLVPTVAFAVREDGHDLDAFVTIDENPTPLPVGRSTRLDPGIHRIQWKSITGAPREGTEMVTVFEGQRGRFVVLEAAKKAPPSSAAEPSKSDLWPWFLIGAGGLLILGGGVYELVAINEDSQRKALDLTLARDDLSSSERSIYLASRESHRDAAETGEAIGITIGVVGLTALAAGVTWAIVRDRTSSRTAKGTNAAVRLAPKLGTVGFAF